MLRIDNSLLEEVGLGTLPDSEKNSLLKHILETLEMRVGVRLADQMTNEQLDEFERYFEAKDDAGAFKWLETNFPNYKDIVQEEFNKLKAEITQSAPQILSSSQAQNAQLQSAPSPQYNPSQQAPQMPPANSMGQPMTATSPLQPDSPPTSQFPQPAANTVQQPQPFQAPSPSQQVDNNPNPYSPPVPQQPPINNQPPPGPAAF
jgi:hypothetical protein